MRKRQTYRNPFHRLPKAIHVVSKTGKKVTVGPTGIRTKPGTFSKSRMIKFCNFDSALQSERRTRENIAKVEQRRKWLARSKKSKTSA